MTKCNKPNVFKLNISLYYQDIIVIINVPDEKLPALLKAKKLFKTKQQIDTFLEPFINAQNTAARTVYYDNGGIAIRFYNKDLFTDEGLSIIAHEVVHACSFIFERIGMEHNSETDEAYAYLMGYIYKEIISQILSTK